MKDHKGLNRVVVTGVGAISPLGSSVARTWEGWMQGRSGIRRITQFDASELPCQIAGEIPDFEPATYIEPKEARRIPRSGQIALACAIQAVQDAGLPEIMTDQERYPPPYEAEALAGFRREQQPARTALADSGVSFHRHYVGATACLPSDLAVSSPAACSTP